MEMTCTMGLVKLKTLAKRIERATNECELTSIQVANRKLVNGKTAEDFKDEAKAKWQKVTDLIKYRNEIKKALVKSNAKTKIKVGDQEMTIAEAVDMKNAIDFEVTLLSKIKEKLNVDMNQVATHNANVDRQLDDQISKMVDASTESKDSFMKLYRDENTAKLINPVDVEKKIEKMERKIDTFLENIDEALSVSNASTTIVVGMEEPKE